jgi:hypothetical protein
VVNRAGEIFVDGRGAVCEGFVGRAVACADVALAAFSGALIVFETEVAIAPVLVAAPRAWRGYPVVIFSVVVALHANGHAREGTSTLFLFNIGSCCFPVETPRTGLQKGLVWGGNGFSKRARGSGPRIRKVGGCGVGDGFARFEGVAGGDGFAKRGLGGGARLSGGFGFGSWLLWRGVEPPFGSWLFEAWFGVHWPVGGAWATDVRVGC